MVLGDKKMYLFGGKGASYFNDFYVFNCATLAWAKPRVTGNILFFGSFSFDHFFLALFFLMVYPFKKKLSRFVVSYFVLFLKQGHHQ